MNRQAKGRIKELIVGRYYDPVVINHDIDVAAIIMWFIYGSWGILTVIVNQSVLKQQFEFYPVFWGMSIGILAWVGGVSAAMGFLLPLTDYRKRIFIKKVEAYSIGLMVGFVVAYPIIMWANVLLPRADTPARLDIAVFSLSYMIFPMWRVKHLLWRVTQLRSVQRKYPRHGS